MEVGGGTISIALVNGSVRPGNYTGKALALVAEELARDARVTVTRIEPAELALPMPGLDPEAAGARRLRSEVQAAAAVVLATPEYHGGMSSVIKLVIENLGFPSAISGKPVVLVGVAAGAIGAVKSLEQLRSVAAHVGANVLPLAISIAGVQKAFDADGRCVDPLAEKNLRRAATMLLDYLGRHVCPAMTLERLLREGAGAKG